MNLLYVQGVFALWWRMSQTDLSAVRAKAWKSRREKYGPRGHNGYRLREQASRMRPVVDVAPEIECEDGYPTPESLGDFLAVQLSRGAAAKFLAETFPALCTAISCCSCRVASGVTIMGKPAREITFTTGGWSGAESLIGAMLSHVWIKQMHMRWERGGLFVFEVPEARLIDKPVRS